MAPMSASTLYFSLVLYVSFLTMVSGAEETTPPPPESEMKKLAMTPTGGKVPFWTLGESAFVDGTDVHLVGKDARMKGTLWANEQNHADQWEVKFEVSVNGNADKPGKGLAFWYTSNIMAPGILFGSEERYEGFGLLFDSYDDDGKNDNPIIMGWINDGTKVFNHDTDGLGTRFGGCRAKYRNLGNKVGVKVQYQGDSLKVLLDMRNNGVWERCLVKDNIYLAAGSYFGFSGANQADAEGDEVRVLSFKAYDLETKDSIARQEAELKAKEESERKARMGTGEIHDLAEQMTGMQKDLHDEFLQKISDMIQRDHVTASHEFRSIRTQLTDTIDSAAQPLETLQNLQNTVTSLSSQIETLKSDLEALREAKSGSTGNDIGAKLESFQSDIQKIKDSVQQQFAQQKESKNKMLDHIDVVENAVGSGTSSSNWTYIALFQVLFVVALVMYRRTGGVESKQHLV